MSDAIMVEWAFLERKARVFPLGERVAYSWTCKHAAPEQHVIECLWVWHDCDLSLDPARRSVDGYAGWKPTGVAAHTLIQAEPLTIVASVYWPECCGLHGFITAGRWDQV